jgi:preprotein translocase subunit SecG
MSRNEIRLRKGKMSSGDIARHRNYGKLMRHHRRYLRMKRSILVLVYFLIIVLMIFLYMLTRKSEQKKQEPDTKTVQIENYTRHLV